MRILVLLLCWGVTWPAQAGMRGPEDFAPHYPRSPESASLAPASLPAQWGLGLIRGFQVLLSPLDGPRSPSYPTGSAYGKDALQQHGLFWGVILTADRLLHEADVPLGPLVEQHGVLRFYDPLSRNDHWLRGLPTPTD